jgi:putative DNA primase/helicase
MARALGGAAPAGGGWKCRCPAHEDGKPSLSLDLGEGGRLLTHCFAGCTKAAVFDGLKAKGVLLNGDARPAEPRPKARARPRQVATYVYTDENDRPLFRVARMEPKSFPQSRYENGEWIGGKGAMDGVRRVLFRLPQVIAAEEVVLCEGEKDALNVAAAGLCGTTSPQGAGFWRDELAAPLAGKRVVILPDADEAGREHARTAAAAARGAGAVSVKLIELPGLPEKGDVSDWLADGHTIEDLRALIAKAPEWEPPQRDGPEDQARISPQEALDLGDTLLDLSHDGLALALGEEWADQARHVALWGKWLFWNGPSGELDERLLHMTRARGYLRHRADGLVRASEADAIEGSTSRRPRPSPRRCARRRPSPTSSGWPAATPGQAAASDGGTPTRGCSAPPAGPSTSATGDAPAAAPGDYISPKRRPWRQRPPARRAALAGVPRAHLPPRPRADRLRAAGARLRAHRPHDRARPGVRLGAGRERQVDLVQHRLTAARRLRHHRARRPPARHPRRPPPDRHGDVARRPAGDGPGAGPGRAWDEPKLKSLTGGDPITARFMRQDFFTYEPQFTLVASGNHKPSFKGVDEAIRRRVDLIPFLQNIPAEERDKELPGKLTAEGPPSCAG